MKEKGKEIMEACGEEMLSHHLKDGILQDEQDRATT